MNLFKLTLHFSKTPVGADETNPLFVSKMKAKTTLLWFLCFGFWFFWLGFFWCCLLFVWDFSRYANILIQP